jgi:hypothetical protein
VSERKRAGSAKPKHSADSSGNGTERKGGSGKGGDAKRDEHKDKAHKRDKADRIRDKLLASQARNRGPKSPSGGSDASDNAGERTLFRKTLDEHPVALIAGSMILGAVAANLVPAAVRSKLASRLLGLAAIAGEFGASMSSKAWGAAARSAHRSQERLDDLGEKVADQGGHAARRASELGAIASRRALDLAETAAANARDAGQEALKRLGTLSSRGRD